VHTASLSLDAVDVVCKAARWKIASSLYILILRAENLCGLFKNSSGKRTSLFRGENDPVKYFDCDVDFYV
jgi:hypothetical protein